MKDTAGVDAIAPDSKAASGGLSLPLLLIYALPSIPLAFLFVPAVMLLPAFYASELNLSLSAVGGFILVSRALDVVLDPMIGKWSDSTHSRFGRRKVWMLAGTPLLMVGAYFLFMPPVQPNGWYLLVASFVIYAGGSTLGLPYSAWGTEVVASYHGRARMAAAREAATVCGGLLAASIPAITGYFGHGIDRFTMAILGLVIIVMTPLTVLLAIWRVPEPKLHQRVTIRWTSGMHDLLNNGPFRVLCGAYVLFSLGASFANGAMIFYMNDYLGAPTLVGATLLLLAVTTVLGVPIWLAISHRVGKHRALAYSLFLTVMIFALAVPLLRPGQGLLYMALMTFLGLTSAGFVTLPISIIGDVIDYDALKHRSSRGGLYWGVWSCAQKLAPAIGIGISLPLLEWMGFTPGRSSTEAGLEAVKFMYCFAPVPFMALGGFLMLRFPIDARRHALIRRRLETRAARVRPAAVEAAS